MAEDEKVPQVVIPDNVPDTISLQEFFKMWPISRAVIAERLRQEGFGITAKDLEKAINSEEPDKHEKMLMHIAVLILKHDIQKIKVYHD